MGKLLLSHRYNLSPLLCSHPGGVQRELVVKDLPATKIEKSLNFKLKDAIWPMSMCICLIISNNILDLVNNPATIKLYAFV
jgi:hypothetical protein